MPTRSGVLCSAVSAGAGGFVIGTVTSTDSWVIKDWRIYNSTGAPVNVTLLITNPGGTTFGVRFLASVGAGAFASGNGWVAAMPNAQVQAIPGAAGVHFWVSGADLPGHL